MRREKLETDRFTCVAGAGDNHLLAVEDGSAETVSLVFRNAARVDHFLQHVRGIRPLERDHAERLALVREIHIVLLEALQPFPILRPVPSVDDEQEVLCVEAVKIGVVDGAAGFVGNEGVLGMAGIECTGVVGQRLEQEFLGASTPDSEPAHMGDVEQAGAAPGRQVLLDDAGRVLHRHVPTPEFHHLGTVFHVPFVEYCFMELTAARFGHGGTLPIMAFVVLPLGREYEKVSHIRRARAPPYAFELLSAMLAGMALYRFTAGRPADRCATSA